MEELEQKRSQLHALYLMGANDEKLVDEIRILENKLKQ